MTQTTTPTTQKTALAGVSVGDVPAKPRRVISPLLQQALDAAWRVCEDWQDSHEARLQMKREVLEVADKSPHLLPNLVLALTTLRCKRSDFFTTKRPKE